jgi:hypothetical protein
LREAIVILASLWMAQTEPQSLVPEGVHKETDGPPRLCGFTAANLTDLERMILDDRSFREEGSSEQYRVFNRERDFIQFVFPRSAKLGFPMATCRRLLPAPDGVSLKRELYCDGTREQCDRIFLEFDALDSELTRSSKAR